MQMSELLMEAQSGENKKNFLALSKHRDEA